MKRLVLILSFMMWAVGASAADVIITNITKAAAIPPGSYALGTTGLTTRLLSVDILRTEMTNHVALIAGQGTNETDRISQNATNFGLSVGAAGSNNVMTASNNLTSLALSTTNAYKVRLVIAGTGVTLVTNTTDGSITISSAAGGISVEAGTNGITLTTNGSLVTIHFDGDDVQFGTLSADTLSFAARSGANSNQVVVLDTSTNAVHSTTLYVPTNAPSAGKTLQSSSTVSTKWDDPPNGAPTDADYLVGTTQAGLSAEIVVGTTPGGELGGTWGTPTIDDSVSVTGWTLTTPTISGAVTFPDDTRQTFNPGAAASGLNVGSNAGDPSTLANGDLWYDSTGNLLRARIDGSSISLGAGGGAPTTVDYLVGTSDPTLSAEIVVGTTPGGELGGTWGSPTLDDSVTVTGWELGASTATTASAGDNDTSLATTAFVETRAAATTNESNFITAPALKTGATINAANGASLTNLTYLATTNANNAGNIPLGQIMFTNLTGNIEIAGISGKASADNLAGTAVLVAYGSGSDRTVTFGNPFRTYDNNTVYTVTNGDYREFHITYYPGLLTNVSTVPAR